MKRILLDQGLPALAVKALEAEAWDVVHVRDIGMRDADDKDILDYAARESRVVITLDRDFPQILALRQAARPSVVLLRQQRLRAPDVTALLNSIWRDHETELDLGCVLTVNARGVRVRILPFK